ncbi:hypothetical protein ACFY64_40640 [Streptomyces collinus]|uniref:hypothetical protein n=1 Tax=Streptomyces collinus TaxID=42684 RepID=UPI00368722C2
MDLRFGTRGALRRAPAACWWARHEVESTLTMLQSIRPSAPRLSQVLGEQVWRESGIAGPDETEQLQARITTLEQQVIDLELKIQERDDDLAAARAANRELIAQLNRAAPANPLPLNEAAGHRLLE